MSDSNLTLATIFQAKIDDALAQIRRLREGIRSVAGSYTGLERATKRSSKQIGDSVRRITLYPELSEFQKRMGNATNETGKFQAALAQLGKGKEGTALVQTERTLRKVEGAIQSTADRMNVLGKNGNAFRDSANRINLANQVMAGSLKVSAGEFQRVADATKQSTAAQTASITTARSKAKWMTSLNRMYDQGAISLQEMVTRQIQTNQALQKAASVTKTVTAAQDQSIKTTRSKTRWMTSLNRMYDQNAISLREMVSRQLSANQAVQKSRQATSSATTAVSKNEKVVRASTKSLDAHGKQLSHIEGSWNRVKAAARVTASYGVAATAIYGVVSALRSGVGAIGDYDQSLRNLKAITNATDVEIASMGDRMLSVARETKFSAAEIAEGMQLLGQAGFSAAESLDAIQAVARLATGTLSSLQVTSDLLTTAIRAFGLEANEANRVADVMASSINNSKLTVDKLRIAFNFVGASAAQAGISLEETAASMQLLANSGLRASTIGTGFRQVLAKLISPSRGLREEFERHGVAIENIDLSNYQETMKNLTKVLIDQKTKTVDMAKAYDLFKLRGAQAAAVLIRGFASGNFEKALANVYEVGSATRMAAEQQEGLIIKWKNFQDRAKNVAVALGSAGLTGALHFVVDALRDATVAMESFLNSDFGSTAFQIMAITVAVNGLVRGFRSLAAAYAQWRAMSLVGDTKLSVGLALLSVRWQELRKSMTVARAALTMVHRAAAYFLTSIGGIAVIIAGISVAVYKMANHFKASAKAAEESALAHKEVIESLDSLSQIAGDARDNHQKYISILKRYKQENPEIAKRMVEVSKSVDITTMSFEQLSEAVKKVRLENFKKQIASLGEQFDAIGWSFKIDKLLKSLRIGYEDSNFIPMLKRAYDNNKNLNESLDEQLSVMGNIASAVARYAIDQEMSNEEAVEFSRTMAESAGRSKQFADSLEQWVVKAMEEMREQAERTREAFLSMVKDAPQQYRQFYEKLSLMDQARYAEVASRIEKEVAEYKRQAGVLNHTAEQQRAVEKTIRATALADFIASLTKETDSYQENENRKIEILKNRLEIELSATDEQIEKEQARHERAIAFAKGSNEKVEQENKRHQSVLAGLIEERSLLRLEIESKIGEINRKVNERELEDAQETLNRKIALKKEEFERIALLKKQAEAKTGVSEAESLAENALAEAEEMLRIREQAYQNAVKISKEAAEEEKAALLGAQNDVEDARNNLIQARMQTIRKTHEEEVRLAIDAANRKYDAEAILAERLAIQKDEDPSVDLAQIELDRNKEIFRIREDALKKSKVLYKEDADAAKEALLSAGGDVLRATNNLMKARSDSAKKTAKDEVDAARDALNGKLAMINAEFDARRNMAERIAVLTGEDVPVDIAQIEYERAKATYEAIKEYAEKATNLTKEEAEKAALAVIEAENEKNNRYNDLLATRIANTKKAFDDQVKLAKDAAEQELDALATQFAIGELTEQQFFYRRKALLEKHIADIEQLMRDLQEKLDSMEAGPAFDEASRAVRRLKRILSDLGIELKLTEEKLPDKNVWEGFKKGAKDAANEIAADIKQVSDMTRITFVQSLNGSVVALNDALWNTKKLKDGFRDMARAVLQDLTAMIIKQQLFNALVGSYATTGQLGGAAGAVWTGIKTAFGVAHTGGVVGKTNFPTREFAAPSMIPRFHDGLKPDEFPAILQKGEGVFTKEQMAAMGAGAGAIDIEINIKNESGTPVSGRVGSVSQNGQRYIIGMVLDAAERNVGGFANQLRASIGKA